MLQTSTFWVGVCFFLYFYQNEANTHYMKKLYLAALLALGGLADATAQQDPHYTQYMYNMNVINPAYAGSKENLSFGLLYRKQWVDIEDAPTTMTFAGSSPVGK